MRASINPSPLSLRRLAALLAAVALAAPAAAQDLSRLQSLLDATPEGGWVKANTAKYSLAFPTGSVSAGTMYPTTYGAGAIVYAWGSFAWDSNRGELLLWGGGHANYAGNEMYRWQADTGTWERGSLPSKVLSHQWVIDNAAPQAAHTYDGNIFLPVNDLFVSFGGPVYSSGNEWRTLVNGTQVRAGPWMWDPQRADPNKVGGTNGSGYDASTPGGNMWINRQGQWTGTQGPYSTYASSAYRTEAGQDVVYVSLDSWQSGRPGLFRYTIGDVRGGGLDKWEHIGVTHFNDSIYGGSLTLDSTHNLAVRIAGNGNIGDLAVWNLANANPNNPGANRDIPVNLFKTDGSPFVINGNFAIEYDDANDQFILWEGQQGKVWSTKAMYNGSTLLNSWTVTELASTTTAQPSGGYVGGVLGKFKYIPELDAFIALNEFNTSTLDAEVWLYKPIASQVPEPRSALLALFGGLLLLTWHRRRARQ